MTEKIEELDWKSEELLETLARLDGVATTSEIRDHSAVGENNAILYRVNQKLEPAGVVRSSSLETDEPIIPPKQIELTEKGEELVEELSEEDGVSGDSIPSKIEHLAGQLDHIESRLEALESDGIASDSSSTPEGSDEIAALRAQLENQQKQLARIEQRLDEIEEQAMGGWSAEKQEEFETLWNAMLAMRRFLENEVEPNTTGSLQEYR